MNRGSIGNVLCLMMDFEIFPSYEQEILYHVIILAVLFCRGIIAVAYCILFPESFKEDEKEIQGKFVLIAYCWQVSGVTVEGNRCACYSWWGTDDQQITKSCYGSDTSLLL